MSSRKLPAKVSGDIGIIWYNLENTVEFPECGGTEHN